MDDSIGSGMRFDDFAVKDQFSGVQFSFYTDEEIEKLSVLRVADTIAFDHLNNPTPKGLHSPYLGVSPFDHKSVCPTCGMKVVQCPGHVGHIQLAVPLYNPFLMKDVYKLLKSKCFSCDRLRIHKSKMDALTIALKLLKAGDFVVSHELKNYMMHAATAFVGANSNQLMDSAKLKKLKADIDRLAPKSMKPSEVADKHDLPNFFNQIDNRVNDKKEKHEEDLRDQLLEIVGTPVDSENNTSIQRRIGDLIKEIWSQVVTTVCPHCRYKSPAVKRDGFTKLFVKPLQAKAAQAQQQAKNLADKRKKSRDSSRNSAMDDAESVATTIGGASRKVSSHTEPDPDTKVDEFEPTQAADEESSEEEYKEGGPQKFITPNDVEKHLKRLWEKEYDILSLMYGRFDPSRDSHTETQGHQQFFTRKVIVPPIRFRPESEGGMNGNGGSGDKAYLHTHSAMLMKVLQKNTQIADAISVLKKEQESGIKAANSQSGSITQVWIQLQDAVNIFMDASMAQKTAEKQQQGVRQLLERKEGMFRMKMMGKRVNFGGRSVISPDPNITTDQIGVPVFMARKLTFPESVCQYNLEKLKNLVKSGANQHPGANIVEDERTGQQTLLEGMPYEERFGIADQLAIGSKIVHRHLNNGDVLLVNRQPTLHKPSIMAHIARVLPKEQTIRMHYANCSTYNADFDGDEMNIHLPQSYQAASEAYKLMATHKQYVVPTSGKPIRGLIQDSVVSGVFLSSKDCFLNKEQYMQLVYIGLRELQEEGKLHRIEIMAPNIIKPKPMWTGKQVISTVLKNIVLAGLSPKEAQRQKSIRGMNLEGKSRLNAKEWGPLGKEEGEVIIRDNEHLQGTLDKNQFGSSDQGMVHSFYEVYGSEKAGILLTALARIFAFYLQTHGFTVGLDDLVLKPEFNKQRRMTIEKGHMECVISAAKFAKMKGFKIQKLNYSNRVVFQAAKTKDQDIEKLTKMAIPEDPFDGKKKCITIDDPIRVNIEKMIGQSPNIEELEKELDNAVKNTSSKATSNILKEIIPSGLIKRFPRNNISAMVLTGAKGGVVNQTQISALLGQQELEGRRVPKMQNGKTLPCFLPYDPNPRACGYVSDRFISGLRPQDFFFHCMAGREGLIDTAVKTSRSGYLQRCLIKQLESLIVSYDMSVRDNDGSIVQFLYGEDSVDVMNTQFLNKFKFLENNFSSLEKKANSFINSGAVEIEPIAVEKKRIQKEGKAIMKANPGMTGEEAKANVAEPLIGSFHPLKHFGAISEKMENAMIKYLKEDSLMAKHEKLQDRAPGYKFPLIDADSFKKAYFVKYLSSVVQPGENVGTIAAQSVGEPSTQMTLNTFHLAGHGGANMTLGIPRLKEILMTTPVNIKTPCMTVFFTKEKQKKLSLDQMQQIASSFEKLRFTEVIKNVSLAQTIAKSSDGNFSRLYKLKLEFEEAKMLSDKLGISYTYLCKIFADRFLPRLMDLILKDLRKAAEADMGGLSVSGVDGPQNANDLKKVISKTTKLTKVSRGDAKGNPDDEEQEIEKADSDDSKHGSDDEDERESIEIADTDGRNKKQDNKQNANQDDSSSEVGQSDQNMNMSEQGDFAMDFDEPELADSKQAAKEYSQIHKKFREKYAKYLQYIKGDFEFDEDNSVSVTLSFPLEFKKLLLLSISESALSSVLVRNVKDIEKCSLITGQGSEPYLFVQGINFAAFEKDPETFDLRRTQTNHSYALKQRYGIEACRMNIVKEIRSVFDVYGISVDYRHLSLIADFITYSGDYRSFNRIGMEESSSPFLKMSYETTMKYLIASSTTMDTDMITSPSSALVLGKVPEVGTNCFDLIHETMPLVGSKKKAKKN